MRLLRRCHDFVTDGGDGDICHPQPTQVSSSGVPVRTSLTVSWKTRFWKHNQRAMARPESHCDYVGNIGGGTRVERGERCQWLCSNTRDSYDISYGLPSVWFRLPKSWTLGMMSVPLWYMHIVPRGLSKPWQHFLQIVSKCPVAKNGNWGQAILG